MAFTRNKNSGHLTSKTKVGSDIINPSTAYGIAGETGEPGDFPDYLRATYPGDFAFNEFDGSTDSKGTAHNDTYTGGELGDVNWDTTQHSLWFRDTGSTTT